MLSIQGLKFWDKWLGDCTFWYKFEFLLLIPSTDLVVGQTRTSNLVNYIVYVFCVCKDHSASRIKLAACPFIGFSGTYVSTHGHAQLGLASWQPLRHSLPLERLLQAQLCPGHAATVKSELYYHCVHRWRGGRSAVQRVRLCPELQNSALTIRSALS